MADNIKNNDNVENNIPEKGPLNFLIGSSSETSNPCSIATPINRSEKWGIFFGKYNPSFKTFLIGTGSINLTDYYFGHASKANFGLILPHSSIFSYLKHSKESFIF